MGKGRNSGPARIYPAKKFGISQDVEYVICTDCGYILEAYVVHPDRFKGTR